MPLVLGSHLVRSVVKVQKSSFLIFDLLVMTEAHPTLQYLYIRKDMLYVITGLLLFCLSCYTLICGTAVVKIFFKNEYCFEFLSIFVRREVYRMTNSLLLCTCVIWCMHLFILLDQLLALMHLLHRLVILMWFSFKLSFSLSLLQAFIFGGL